jgi:hypothetical protein
MIRLLFLWCLMTSCLRADEWWAWTALEYWQTPASKAWVFLGNRADAGDGSPMQIVSPRFKHALQPWLDAGVGLSLLNLENTRTGEHTWQLRPELELNPHFNLSRHLALELRNRLEWRWNEAQTFTTHRSRQRLHLAWTLPRPIGPLTRLFASQEWLTDLHRLQQSENRVVPLGVTFKLGAHSDLDVFYMITSLRAQAHWQHESVIGTYLRVRF